MLSQKEADRYLLCLRMTNKAMERWYKAQYGSAVERTWCTIADYWLARAATIATHMRVAT